MLINYSAGNQNVLGGGPGIISYAGMFSAGPPVTATSYSISGSNTSQINVSSGTITLTPIGGNWPSGITITLSDNVIPHGTFSPASILTPAGGTATPLNFTYTPHQSGAINISAVASGVLSNPTPFAYTATGAITSSITVLPTSVQVSTSGNTLTVTGTNTSWTPGTPGSPIFTVSSGIITAQTIISTTSATLTYSSPATPQNIVVTDPSTGDTTTFAVTTAPDNCVIPPTSGSYCFTLDIIAITDEAFSRVGGEQVTGSQQAKAVTQTLPLLLQEWTNKGINLWTLETLTLPLVSGVATYLLPSNTSDILQAVMTLPGGPVNTKTDIPMERISREQYLNINDKTNQSQPLKYWTDRQSGFTTVTVWPVPNNDTYVLTYIQIRYIQDPGVQSNSLDIPKRFLPALVSGLSYKLALKSPELWVKDPAARQQVISALKAEYDEVFNDAREEDRERNNFYWKPSVRHAWRR